MQLSEIIKIGPRAARRQESTEKEEKGKRKEKVLINREERVHGELFVVRLEAGFQLSGFGFSRLLTMSFGLEWGGGDFPERGTRLARSCCSAGDINDRNESISHCERTTRVPARRDCQRHDKLDKLDKLDRYHDRDHR